MIPGAKKNTVEEIVNAIKSSGNLHDGYLLSNEEKRELRERFEKNTELEKISRKDKLSHYSVRKFDGKLIAVYHCEKNDPIAHAFDSIKGTEGIIKIGQDLETGEWVVIKVRKLKMSEDLRKAVSKRGKTEKKILHQENLLIGYRKKLDTPGFFKSHVILKIDPALICRTPC